MEGARCRRQASRRFPAPALHYYICIVERSASRRRCRRGSNASRCDSMTAASEPPEVLLRPAALVADGVKLSLKDRAPQVQVSADGLSASSRKGYRSVRATHGAAAGAWYCEVLLESLGETGHARLGWCVRLRTGLCPTLTAPAG